MNGFWILAVIGKWIGIVLLAVLLLLLLLVFLVLFSPINYRVEGEKKNAPGGLFRVSWLLGAIRCRGSYDADNGLKIRLKVLWLTLPGGEPKEKKTKKVKKRKQNAAQEETAPSNTQPAGVSLIGAREKTMLESEPELQSTPEPIPQSAPKPEPPKAQNMERRQAKTVRRVKLEEIPEPPLPEMEFSEDDDAFFTGEDSGEKTKKGIPPIVSEIIHIEDKKGIFSALGKLLKRLLKGILPGNLSIKGTFGTGDPTTTGYLLAAAGILTARFGNDIQIKGDFSKAAAEDVEIRIKGRIVPAFLLWAVLAFLLTKPVRRALWRLWKARK